MASAAVAASSPPLSSPRKRQSPFGGADVVPSGEARDLVASVGQSIALLASSLFANQVRNRQILPLWLVHPVPDAERDDYQSPTRAHVGGDDGHRELSHSATTWGELERQRASRRRSNVQAAMSKRNGGLDMALDRQRQRMLDNLVPAATAAAGRRVPRASSALRSTVAAMRVSSESAVHRRSSSAPATHRAPAINDAYLGATVDSFATIVRALLLEPIDFTVTAGGGDNCSLYIFPFGDGRLAQFNIPSSLLDVNELRALE